MKKQIRYACGYCQWTIVTDMWAEDEEEEERLPEELKKKWEGWRWQHFVESHPALVKQFNLKLLLRAKV